MMFYPTGDRHVVVDGFDVHHREPGPWSVETFPTGLAVVLNSAGINWVHVVDGEGQTLFSPSIAQEIAAALNARSEAA